MKQHLQLASIIACATFLVSSYPARATTLTTTCYNTGGCANGVWNSSAFITGSSTELNFTTITNATYTSGTTTLTPSGNSSLVFTISGPGLTGNSSFGELIAPSLHIVAPATGETAMALYVTSSGSITVVASDGSTINGSSGWFGFSASHPINSFAITTTASSVAFRDFFFANSSLPQDQASAPTPEAATLIMSCGGLLILFGAVRNLRHERQCNPPAVPA